MDSQELSDTGIFRIQQAARAGPRHRNPKDVGPALKPTVLHGELRHVVSIDGRPFRAHSSLKSAMCDMATAMAGAS